MIEHAEGNLLQADTEALVNTVNCVGYMGKGIALQFKQAYPENFRVYAQACRAKAVQPGRMLIFETGSIVPPKYIINFPTKRHWRGKSRLEDIKSGLAALTEDVKRLGIHSVAIPPLGCGNGGLLVDLAAKDPLFVGWGLELNHEMCKVARARIRAASCGGKTSFSWLSTFLLIPCATPCSGT